MAEGTILEKRTAVGHIVTIIPLTYQRARITVGRDELFYDDVW